MTSRKRSASDKFSLVAFNAVSRSRRQRDRLSEVDQWRVINMPVGYLARRRRSMQLLSLPAEGDGQKEKKRPPKLSVNIHVTVARLAVDTKTCMINKFVHVCSHF